MIRMNALGHSRSRAVAMDCVDGQNDGYSRECGRMITVTIGSIVGPDRALFRGSAGRTQIAQTMLRMLTQNVEPRGWF
jgi:hypothetical protein